MIKAIKPVYFSRFLELGRIDQIQEVMKHITVENYITMYKRVRKMESDDSITGISNFGKYIKFFEGDNIDWIEEINEKPKK